MARLLNKVELLSPVAHAYSARLRAYGATSKGAYWISAERQQVRFDMLLGIIDDGLRAVSINDLGCGYGALFNVVANRPEIPLKRYWGYDICPDMVSEARKLVRDPRAEFQIAASPTEVADYSFASGTFNLRLGADPETWESLIRVNLLEMAERSTKGMAFNLLSRHTHPRDSKDFFVADPARLLDFCLKRLSPDVALFHDYMPGDFTIWVRFSK